MPVAELRRDFGNFGVRYRFAVGLSGSNGNVALMVNPRADVFQGGTWKIGDTGLPAWTPIPSPGHGTGGGNAITCSAGTNLQGVLVEKYTQLPEPRSWEYILPAGSSAPVHIALVPYSWNHSLFFAEEMHEEDHPSMHWDRLTRLWPSPYLCDLAADRP